MSKVRAVQSVPGLASEAEELWYDPLRWPAWVDGFGHVVKLEGEWPASARGRCGIRAPAAVAAWSSG